MTYAAAHPIPAAARAAGGVPRWGMRWAVVAALAWAATPLVGFTAVVALLAVLGFASLAAAPWRPGLALIGAAVLCTLAPFMTGLLMTGGLLRWNTLNYVFVVTACLGWRHVVAREPHMYVFLAFVTLLTAELLLSADLTKGAQDMLGLAAFLGLHVFFQRVREPDDWRWMGLVAGLVGAASGIAYLAESYRAVGVEHLNPNAWSYAQLTALVAIALALPFARTPRSATALMVLAAVNLLCVFLSASRGSMLIAAVVVCYLLAVSGRGLLRAALTLGATALVAASTVALPDARALAMHRLSLLVDDRASAVDRTSGRVALVEGGLVLFTRAPLGIGTGGFAPAWATLEPRDGLPAWGRNEEHLAHAGWLKVLVENGLPGVLLLAAFVGGFAVRGARSPEWERRCLGVLATVVLGVAFLSTEFQSKGLWLLAAGVMRMLTVRAPTAVGRRVR